MKKMICILVAFLCIIAMVPMSVYGADSVADGSCGAGGGKNVQWKIYDNGLLELTGSGSMENYTGHESTPWYSYKDMITSVTIADGIDNIGDYAFSHLSGIAALAIPASVRTIGKRAFYESAISSISIPEGVTSIGEYAFTNSGITSLTIPSTVESIGMNAFSGCTGIVSVTVPKTVTEMGMRVFNGCTGLESAEFYADVDTIPEYLFCGCTKLQNIKLGTDYTGIGSYAFSETALGNMTVPSGVKTIGTWAFYKCADLASVSLPAGLETIDMYAFEETGLTSVTIPSSVTSITKYAFRSCAALENVTINANISTLGYETFKGCSALKSITLPTTLTTLGSNTFKGCTSLESIDIPSGVTSIGERMFEGCTKLSSVILPSGINSVGAFAFSGCKSLKDISLPAGVTEIKDNVFENCSSLESFEIKNTVTEIGGSAFKGCSSLTKITVPSSVAKIGSHAFCDCVKLKEVHILNADCTVYQLTFENCNAVTEVTVPFKVQTAGLSNIFPSYRNITKVIFADGTKEIYMASPYGLAGCTAVNTVVIPESVTIIDYDAFKDTSALTDVHYKGTEEQWNEIDIWGTDPVTGKNQNLLKATLHYESDGTHEHAFGEWEKFDEDTHKHECECGEAEYADHVWGNGIIEELPTPEKEGVMKYTCTVCGETKEEPIEKVKCVFETEIEADKDGDTLEDGDNVTFTFTPEDGTAAASGAIYFKASSNLEFVSSTVDGESEDLVPVIAGDENGSYAYIILSMHNVSVPEISITYTFTADSGCNEVVFEYYILDLVDEYENAITFTTATENNHGTHAFRVHSFGAWEKYSESEHIHHCECGETEYEVHRWDEGIVTVEPAADKKGERLFTCLDCGETRTEEIDNELILDGDSGCEMTEKNGVKYITGISKETAAADAAGLFENESLVFVNDSDEEIGDDGYVGTGSKVCLTDPYTDEVLDEAVIIVLGDLSGDGKVQSVDALLALKQSVGTILGTDATLLAGDLDASGKITSAEALRILKYSVGTIPSLIK